MPMKRILFTLAVVLTTTLESAGTVIRILKV